jgi:hypothetical protein
MACAGMKLKLNNLCLGFLWDRICFFGNNKYYIVTSKSTENQLWGGVTNRGYKSCSRLTINQIPDKRNHFSRSLHRGTFCQFPFRWIHYYGSNESTVKETGKTHLCALQQEMCQRLNKGSMYNSVTDHVAMASWASADLLFQGSVVQTPAPATWKVVNLDESSCMLTNQRPQLFTGSFTIWSSHWVVWEKKSTCHVSWRVVW